MDGPFSYFIEISYGSIYPTLAKLELDGLVAFRTEQDSGKPERKVYTLTESGRQELVRSLGEPPQPDRLQSEFLLVAMTAEVSEKATLAAAVDERIARLEAELAMLAQHKAECSHPATAWVISYGEHVMSADLTYLRNNRDMLLALAGRGEDVTQAAE